MGPVWNAQSLFGGDGTNELIETTSHPGYTMYERKQNGVLMSGYTYTASHFQLKEDQTGDVGTYDPSTGTITWVPANRPGWTRVGVFPELSGQKFLVKETSGLTNLYLHGQGRWPG